MTENKHTYYGDGVILTAGFDLHAAAPLDYRTLFTDWTNTSLSEVPADVLFVGLLASDETDKKVKILKTKPANASTAADCTWEEIGKVLSEGNGISISNDTVSVKYDNSTIKVDGSGNLYVSGDTSEYTEGDNIDITNHAISALGYTWDSDNKSFAEGKFTSSSSSPAEGKYSHVEGRETKTQGQASHAEGYNTIAEGKASHAEGFGILCNTSDFSWEYTASHNASIKIIISESKKTNLTLANEFYFANLFDFVEKSIYSRATKQQKNFSIKYIGVNNGEIEFDPTPGYYDDTDVNQITVYLAVDTSIFLDEGETFDIIIPVYADELAAHAEGKNTYAQNKNSHTEGLLTQTLGENSHAEGHLTFINGDGYNAHAEGYNTRALKNQAHSEGANTQAYGENSHVEGEEVCAWGKDSHAEGKSSTSPALYDDAYFDDSLINVYNEWASFESDDDSYSCAWGNVSHVEGKNNLALGNNSHAEGQGTCAYGDKSHAEGSNTLAKNNNTHAEGDGAKALGFTSHAEGQYTTAEGQASHAEGLFTVTNNTGEHAEGTYNVSHLGTIHSIGIGNNDFYGGSKNALEIMNNGDTYLYGVGSYLGTSIDSPVKSLQTVISELLSTVIPTGTIQMYAGTSAPTGWLLCDGSEILLTEVSSPSSAEEYDFSYTGGGTTKYMKATNPIYSSLVRVIYDKFGVQSGSGGVYYHVYLPDMKQKFPLGAQSTGTIGIYWNDSTSSWGHWATNLGSTGGEDTTELYASNLPDHKHGVTTYASSSGNGAIESEGNGGTSYSTTTDYDIYTPSGNKIVDGTPSSGQILRINHNNIPPFLAVNFIIKY